MEDPNLVEKHHGHPATLALTDFCSKFHEKRLNIAPLNIGLYWMGKYGLQSSLMLSPHTEMVLLLGTTDKDSDREQTIKNRKFKKIFQVFQGKRTGQSRYMDLDKRVRRFPIKNIPSKR